MNTAEYHKMHAMERTYWWFQGRRRIILGTLDRALRGLATTGKRPRFLDVGCGTGMMLEDLAARGFAAGLDFSPIALSYCRERHLANLGRADVRHLPVRAGSVDVITALDLIEHIRDDHGLLGEFHRVLRPGGIAVMSVPAHKHLWSAHDVALHHYRRYEKREFRDLVTGAGLAPVRYTYTVSSAYYPVVAYRKIKNLFARGNAEPKTDEFPLPRPVNAALLGLLNCEAGLLERHNLPFGLSLLCVAKKP